MRKTLAPCAFASILVAGAVAASSLYAQDNREAAGSMMDKGMMGMGMMMKRMTQMMDHCNGMMNRTRPNEQWRENKSSAPEKNG